MPGCFLVHLDLSGVQDFTLQNDGRPIGRIKLSQSFSMENEFILLDRAATTNNEFIFLLYYFF
jgi:hypothetical protein